MDYVWLLLKNLAENPKYCLILSRFFIYSQLISKKDLKQKLPLFKVDTIPLKDNSYPLDSDRWSTFLRGERKYTHHWGRCACVFACCVWTCMYTPVCFTCVYIMFMHMCLHVSAYGSVCIYVGLPMLVRLSVVSLLWRYQSLLGVLQWLKELLPD